MAINQLLPCPFCGGQSDYCIKPEGISVICKTCKSQTRTLSYFELGTFNSGGGDVTNIQYEKVSKLWNNRNMKEDEK